MATSRAWPELDRGAYADTLDTLHRWAQVIGKVRLARSPHLNHFWEATLYVTARGLTTGTIPYGDRTFAIALDLCDHQLLIESSDGGTATRPLRAQPIARFFRDVGGALTSLGIDVAIWPVPVEFDDRTPFDHDERPRHYDPHQAHRLWLALARVEPVFQRFRAEFVGKSSPVHLYWGAFDLAVTRYSGRRAPLHPGSPNIARRVVREAYSHEVSSAGFWFGGPALEEAAFYAYAYPEPERYAETPVEPEAAYYHPQLREFVLTYGAVRATPDPEATLLRYLHSTYENAASLARWDRAALEGPPERFVAEATSPAAPGP